MVMASVLAFGLIAVIAAVSIFSTSEDNDSRLHVERSGKKSSGKKSVGQSVGKLFRDLPIKPRKDGPTVVSDFNTLAVLECYDSEGVNVSDSIRIPKFKLPEEEGGQNAWGAVDPFFLIGTERLYGADAMVNQPGCVGAYYFKKKIGKVLETVSKEHAALIRTGDGTVILSALSRPVSDSNRLEYSDIHTGEGESARAIRYVPLDQVMGKFLYFGNLKVRFLRPEDVGTSSKAGTAPKSTKPRFAYQA